MVEMYSVQRYLQYDTLAGNGLQHFDAWASTFGETVTALELAPEGSNYRAKTRFAKFYNLPELMQMFPRNRRHPDRRHAEAARTKGQLPQYQDEAEPDTERDGGGACKTGRESEGKACETTDRQHAENRALLSAKCISPARGYYWK